MRLSASRDGSSVEFHYTDDAGKPGWYPRGVADHTAREFWPRHFPHPTNPSIQATAVDIPIPCTEKGHRQEWVYNVQYDDGSEKDFFIPCKPITIDFDPTTDFVALLEKFYTHAGHRNKPPVVSKFAKPEVREAQLQEILRLLHEAKVTDTYAAEVRNTIIILISIKN
jgi:hypothetical protein